MPTSGGPVWLTTTDAEVAFEAGLYELLVRVVPERVLTQRDLAPMWRSFSRSA